jgi:type II secretory pathway component PulK
MKNAKNSGSLLIVASWMLILIALMIAGLAYRQNLQAKMLRYELGSLQSDWQLVGVMNGIRYLLEHDPEAAIDYPDKEIFKLQKLKEKLPWMKELDIQVVDEDSKINLNTASPECLKKLFELVNENEKIRGNQREMIQNILEWRGAKGGVRSDDQKSDVKAKPFDSVEELLLVKEVTYPDYVILKNYLTVYNTQAGGFTSPVNINTASDLVLKCLIESFSADSNDKETLLEEILKYRTRKIDEKKMERTYFTDTDLDPYRMIELMKLSPTITMVGLLTQLRPLVTVDSQAFQLSIGIPIEKNRKRRFEIVLGPSRARSNTSINNNLTVPEQQTNLERFGFQEPTPPAFPEAGGVNIENGDQDGASVLHWYEK